MMDFIVASLPRCGSTWMANWLTTDTSLCLHDAIGNYSLQRLDSFETKKTFGISDTGVWLDADWLNHHPSRKLVVVRNHSDINKSLRETFLPEVTSKFLRRIERIDAPAVRYEDIFNDESVARAVYEYLLQKEFDRERYEALKEWFVQPNFEKWVPDKNVMAQFFERMKV